MMNAETLLIAKTILVFSWFSAFFVFERRFPAAPWKQSDQGFSQARHLRGNLTLWLLNVLLSRLLVLPVTLLAVDLGTELRSVLGIPFTAQQSPLALVVDVIFLDFWIYWWHRLNHEVSFFWRFHRVHHLDQQLDSTTAFRFHFGEVALSALARAPVILLLAMPLYSVLVFETLVLMAAIFHHSNVHLSYELETGLSRLLITPGIHWVHHHAVREDTDSNYGTLFSFWDRIFHSVGPGTRKPGMMLGVAGLSENRLARLLLLPFRSGNR